MPGLMILLRGVQVGCWIMASVLPVFAFLTHRSEIGTYILVATGYACAGLITGMMLVTLQPRHRRLVRARQG